MRWLLKLCLVTVATVSLFGMSLAQPDSELEQLVRKYDELQKAGKYSEVIPVGEQILAIRQSQLGPDDVLLAVWLNNVGELYRNQGRYADAERLLQRSLAIREKALGHDHVDVAQSLNNLAMLFQTQGRYAEAERLYSQSLSVLERALGRGHPNVATSLNNLAFLYQSRARYAEAERLHRRALAIREKALGHNHPNVGASLNNLGLLYKDRGRYAEAEPAFKQAVAIFEKTLAKEHPEVAISLNNLALLYLVQSRYAEAEPLLRRSLAIRERALGSDHPDVAQSLNNLGFLYRDQGRYGDAQPLLQRSLAIWENTLGRDHPDIATALNNLGFLFRDQGRYSDAEPLLRRSLTIREKTFGPDHPDVAQSLNNLAFVYQEQGRYAEARPLFLRSLVVREKALDPDHPDIAQSLNNLGFLYRDQGRDADAEPLLQRSLAIRERALGPDNPNVAVSLNNLGFLYRHQHRYAEAEPLLQRSLAILERSLGPEHPEVAQSLNNLGLLYRDQGRYGEAEPLLQRSLAILERTLGDGHPNVAQSLNSLALLHQSQGRYAEAEAFHKRALAILDTALVPGHPTIAATLDHLARLHGQIGNADDALAYSRKATASAVAHADVETTRGVVTDGIVSVVGDRADYFVHHVANLAAASRKGLGPEADLGREALIMAQWAKHSAAATAVAQMSLRFAAGSDALAALVRERQDLSAYFHDRDKALIAALAKPQPSRNAAAIAGLRGKLSEIESKLAANMARLEREFPEYAEFANGKPVKAEQVQQLLGAEEALLFWLTGTEGSFVFALTRDGFDWHPIAMNDEQLAHKVSALRAGLELERLHNAPEKPALFDTALAHELYVTLIGPVEELVRGRRHLIVVPSGPLTSLPFHLLVTDKPAKPTLGENNFALSRDTAWLIKRHAVSVLPSVASLRALRVFARKSASTKAMIGFGDPIFDPAERARTVTQRGATSSRPVAVNRGVSELWDGLGVDLKNLAQALPSLLETAEELEAVAGKVGASRTDIHLQKDASETTVKRAPLADYRIIYFATHGLLAGDVKGLGEPALALTIPKAPSDLDDGLLTASEIAQLKLDADWVVLSACNTAGGDKPGAEPLSGLARAFFYAGAHALLVSQWSVDTDAAIRLTTMTFDILHSDPGLGRAEALRRAMITLMNDATDPRNAYPAMWAPFIVVGEGAARSS
jgi:tetratricopeptide (TPR) repeat protein/CHAT domain-containing protein